MNRRHVLALPFLIALLGLNLGAAATALAATGSAWPTQASVGTRIHFSATGFTPGERVDLWVSDPGGRSEPRYPSVTADTDGAAVWSWDVAAGAANGGWTMSARGVTSQVVVAIPFSVSDSPPVADTITVAPASGAPGTTFSFQATALTPGKAVGAWLVDPSGASRDLVPGEDPGLVADATGGLAWSWTAPGDVAGGTWQMVVRDGTTGADVVVAFTVVAPARAAAPQTVAPLSGAPGTIFRVSVGGFTPGEQVGSWLVSPAGTSVDATPYLVADADGVVSWAWSSPPEAQAGVWQAVTRGHVSGVEVQLPFSVTGSNGAPDGAAAAVGSVSPESGSAGTSFTFTFDGFGQSEQVAYWPTRPDGTAETTRRTPIRADDDGQVVLTWTAPAQAPSGAWSMTFEGLGSGQVLTAVFQIEATAVAGASVSPARGAPGASFTFTASGFHVIERLDTWIEQPDGSIIAGPTGARADGEGVATWTWTAPADAPGGTWTMVARGQDSDLTYRLVLTVEGDTAPAAAAAVTPNRGVAGTTFTFTATGFGAGERVGYWLNLPDGSIQRFDHELRAGADGTVTWSYTAPIDAPTGVYTMAARSSQSDGIDHDLRYELAFTVA